ncbi:MAG: hypothetical protein ACKVTZ_07395 [Bacteroidia bacterium]
MGGNAIKMSRRYAAAEYYVAQKEIENILKQANVCYYFVRPYSQKDSFGDMDILIQKEEDAHYRNKIVQLFSYQEIHKSGDVWSINYEKLQVDFIFVNKREWELSKYFFDFNDLGALVGKIARFHKLKFGFQGLEFELYYREKKAEFLISLEPEKIFDFLGFDVARYQQGFETLEEVFQYVVDSRYYNHATFEKVLEKEGQRTTDTQRPSYQRFLKYIENHRVELQRPDVEDVLQRVDAYFDTNLQTQIAEKKAEIDLDILVHEKFNGHHVIAHLGLEGKELGATMQKFHASFADKQAKQAFILNNSLEEILTYLKKIRASE